MDSAGGQMVFVFCGQISFSWLYSFLPELSPTSSSSLRVCFSFFPTCMLSPMRQLLQNCSWLTLHIFLCHDYDISNLTTCLCLITGHLTLLFCSFLDYSFLIGEFPTYTTVQDPFSANIWAYLSFSSSLTHCVLVSFITNISTPLPSSFCLLLWMQISFRRNWLLFLIDETTSEDFYKRTLEHLQSLPPSSFMLSFSFIFYFYLCENIGRKDSFNMRW
jgi:hypothetical protein